MGAPSKADYANEIINTPIMAIIAPIIFFRVRVSLRKTEARRIVKIELVWFSTAAIETFAYFIPTTHNIIAKYVDNIALGTI